MTGRDSFTQGKDGFPRKDDTDDGPGVFPILSCPVCGADGKIVSFMPMRWKVDFMAQCRACSHEYRFFRRKRSAYAAIGRDD